MEKIELDEKEILKIIEEKEIEIESQKKKLQIANEEIEKIILELKEIKSSINESIKNKIDIKEKEFNDKNSNIELSERNNSISIEMVESDEENEISDVINKIINEVEAYDGKEEKLEVSEKVHEEISVEIDLEENKDSRGLLESLQLSFIENNNLESIEILNKILNDKTYLETIFNENEKIILLYLSYFYNKLEELLNKNKVISDYYNSQIVELKLLSMLIDEKDYPLYKELNEIVAKNMQDNKKLFKNLDTMIRVRIIDKINNMALRAFDGVYSIKDLKCGEENVSLKAWVKEKNKEQWRLVEGLYSTSTERLYMLDSSIYVLNLNMLQACEGENKDIYKEKIKIESKEDIIAKENSTALVHSSNYQENDESDDIEEHTSIWKNFKSRFKLKVNKK